MVLISFFSSGSRYMVMHGSTAMRKSSVTGVLCFGLGEEVETLVVDGVMGWPEALDWEELALMVPVPSLDLSWT